MYMYITLHVRLYVHMYVHYIGIMLHVIWDYYYYYYYCIVPINNVEIHVLYIYTLIILFCVHLVYMYMCGECVHVFNHLLS